MTSKPVETVHLGQFTDEHANEIAGALEEAQIVWWYKQPSYLSRLWERGTRLFVDKERLEEARRIAEGVLRNVAGEKTGEAGPDQ